MQILTITESEAHVTREQNCYTIGSFLSGIIWDSSHPGILVLYEECTVASWHDRGSLLMCHLPPLSLHWSPWSRHWGARAQLQRCIPTLPLSLPFHMDSWGVPWQQTRGQPPFREQDTFTTLARMAFFWHHSVCYISCGILSLPWVPCPDVVRFSSLVYLVRLGMHPTRTSTWSPRQIVTFLSRQSSYTLAFPSLLQQWAFLITSSPKGTKSVSA